MATRTPRYSKEVFAQRGNEIYERNIRTEVEAENRGKFVAIDIESGAWEMDSDEIVAGDRLVKRFSDAQTWMVRVGYSNLRRFGAGRIRSAA